MAQGCGSQSGVIPRDAASATLDGFRVITCVLPAMVVREFTNLSARTPVVTVTVARCQHNTAASTAKHKQCHHKRPPTAARKAGTHLKHPVRRPPFGAFRDARRVGRVRFAGAEPRVVLHREGDAGTTVGQRPVGLDDRVREVEHHASTPRLSSWPTTSTTDL